MDKCPFCGLNPYEYVDVGIGSVAVAVNCCEMGYDLIVNGADFDALATQWMAGARATIDRYEYALREIAWRREKTADEMWAIADEAVNGPAIDEEHDDGDAADAPF